MNKALRIITLLISLLALAVSVASWINATGARSDARAIAHLDLVPEMRLNTIFEEQRNLPPRLLIGVDGPVDAIQVVVELLSLRYYSSQGKWIALLGSDWRFEIGQISPLDPDKVILFPNNFLDTDARLGEPLERNVIEVRISYSRESDRRRFAQSALFFINPEGRWVSEIDTSIKSPKYDQLKIGVLEYIESKPNIEFPSNILHSVPVERE